MTRATLKTLTMAGMAALALAGTAPAEARVLLGDEFTGFVPGRVMTGGRLVGTPSVGPGGFDGGMGWISMSRRADYRTPLDGRDAVTYEVVPGTTLDPRQGTLEFWVKRAEPYPVVPVSDGWEALATFLGDGPAGRQGLVTMYLKWGDTPEGVRSGVGFWTRDEGERIWGTYVPFPKEPGVGEWFHLALTWGEDPERDNGVWFNGQKLTGRYRTFFGGSVRGKELVEGWASPRELLAKAAEFRLGLDGERGIYPRGMCPMYTTVVDSWNLSDEVKREFDLRKPLEMPSTVRYKGPAKVEGLTAVYREGGVDLMWPASADAGLVGYNVYRREGVGSARWGKRNGTLLGAPGYRDEGLEEGKVYWYSVSGMDGKGIENTFPYEVKVVAADLFVASVEVEGLGRPFGPGEVAGVHVRGTPGAACEVEVGGVGAVPGVELEPGVYAASVALPPGTDGSRRVVARIANAGRSVEKAGEKPLLADGRAPGAPGGLTARVEVSPVVELTWTPVADEGLRGYRVYRGKAGGGLSLLGAELKREAAGYEDGTGLEGTTYEYGVTAVDLAGNESAPGKVTAATGEDRTAPGITRGTESTGGLALKEGEALTLRLYGEGRGGARYELREGAGALATGGMSEVEPGEYEGVHVARAQDAGRRAAAVLWLEDAAGNASSLRLPVEVAFAGEAKDLTAPGIAGVEHDGRRAAGYSGSLVAGQEFHVVLRGEAGGRAWARLGPEGRRVDLAETEPGAYGGLVKVEWGDALAGPVLGYLADGNGNVGGPAESGEALVIDTRVRLLLETDRGVLPADKASKAKLRVRAKDANGSAVKDHRLAVNLLTTEEYTGLVGAGAMGSLKVAWQGETDARGEVEGTYVAGFAAKTAILVVTDLLTGDVGVGYVRAQVEGTVEIELVAPVVVELGLGYRLVLTSDRKELTADGESQARLVGVVTGPDGYVKGDRVSFSVSEELGSIRAVRAVTDERGQSLAVFTAGTRIGTALVTAVDTTRGITGSFPLILMSDAPAKVRLTSAAKSLPADGKAKTALNVKVTDINDNPNQNTEVRFWVEGYNGEVTPEELLTDYNGEGASQYRAGKGIGKVVVRAQVTSSIPTAEELRRGENAFSLPEVAGGASEVRVAEWLAEPGDQVVKGQPLLRYEAGREEGTLPAPRTGTLTELFGEFADTLKVGQLLGVIVP